MIVANSKYQDCIHYKGKTPQELEIDRILAKKHITAKNPCAKYIRFWEDNDALIGRIDVSQEPIGTAEIDGYKMWCEDINNQKVVS